MQPADVYQAFKNEFGLISEQFTYFDLPLSEAETSNLPDIWHPGVYVFWHKSEVIKVGRALTNSRLRALQHITDNTGGSMAALTDEPDARLLLFNIKDVNSLHWVAALEVFFEMNLLPNIKSKRLA